MITASDVASFLKLPPGESESEPLQLATAAAVALVESYHGPIDNSSQPAGAANMKLGTIMLAARVYRRRNSPAGVEALGELGPVYVSRNDPDLAQLLKIGRYQVPRVG